MSLREEIADLLAKRYFEVGFFPTLEAYPADLEIAEELVNKVLDAAVEAANNTNNPCQVVSTPAFLRIRNDVIKAINKLRGE